MKEAIRKKKRSKLKEERKLKREEEKVTAKEKEQEAFKKRIGKVVPIGAHQMYYEHGLQIPCENLCMNFVRERKGSVIIM